MDYLEAARAFIHEHLEMVKASKEKILPEEAGVFLDICLAELILAKRELATAATSKINIERIMDSRMSSIKENYRIALEYIDSADLPPV
jgi:hypothetical protein